LSFKTQDDSSGFKSSFAREVMQNVRKNVTHQTTPARRYLAINATENGEELFTSSTPKHGSFYSHGKENLSAAKGARLSMPAMNTSRRPPSFTSSKYRSQFAARNLLVRHNFHKVYLPIYWHVVNYDQGRIKALVVTFKYLWAL